MIELTHSQLNWLLDAPRLDQDSEHEQAYLSRHKDDPSLIRDNTTGKLYRITSDNGAKVILSPVVGKRVADPPGQGDLMKPGKIDHGTQPQDQGSLF